MNVTANENLQRSLPSSFNNRFQALCHELFEEVRTHHNTRKEIKLRRSDRQLQETYEQVATQMRAKQINLGYGINLLVAAIELHGRYTGSQRFSSDARLQRALTTFRDQERRNFAAHFDRLAVTFTRDPSCFRQDFIKETHEDGYVSFRDDEAGVSHVIATRLLADRMTFPLELSPDDCPMTGDFKGIFRFG